MKRIVVATEDANYDEALYVDGHLVKCETTIHASEIANAANGEPAIVINRQVSLYGEDFPMDESLLVDAEEPEFVIDHASELLKDAGSK